MSWWQYILAVGLILLVAAMIFAGVFELIALRDQNEPKQKDLHQYYKEHPDERPKR